MTAAFGAGTAEVRSVNRANPTAVPGIGHLSGIDKRPVEVIRVDDPGPRAALGGSGVAGDHIGDLAHHGGDDQAVYAFAAEEMRWWATELGRDLPFGVFGENLTTVGLDVDAALIGERWRIGAVLLRVCGPRVPCRTFAAHLGERGWVKRFTDRGRTGAYLAVEEPGEIRPGQPIAVVFRPAHAITVPAYFRALTGDDVAAHQVLDSGLLPDWRAERLARKVRARRAGPP